MFDLFLVPKGKPALSPKETFVQSAEVRERTCAYGEDPLYEYPPAKDDDSCDGTAYQDTTTAATNGKTFLFSLSLVEIDRTLTHIALLLFRLDSFRRGM